MMVNPARSNWQLPLLSRDSEFKLSTCATKHCVTIIATGYNALNRLTHHTVHTPICNFVPNKFQDTLRPNYAANCILLTKNSAFDLPPVNDDIVYHFPILHLASSGSTLCIYQDYHHCHLLLDPSRPFIVVAADDLSHHETGLCSRQSSHPDLDRGLLACAEVASRTTSSVVEMGCIASVESCAITDKEMEHECFRWSTGIGQEADVQLLRS